VDCRLTSEQLELQDTSRRFATEQMTPVGREIEQSAQPLSHDWLHRYAEMRFLGINVATEYGGMGLGNLEALLVLEELAKVSPTAAFPIFESSVGPVRAIERFAGEALKRRVLPASARSMSKRIRLALPSASRNNYWVFAVFPAPTFFWMMCARR